MLYAGSALTGKVFQGLGKSSKFNIWASRYQVSEIVVIRIFQGSQRVLARGVYDEKRILGYDKYS